MLTRQLNNQEKECIVTRAILMSLGCVLLATAAAAQEDIAPPADLNIQPPPVETVPAPEGRRDGRLQLGRDIDLGNLRGQIGPEGRRLLRRHGDRGISFGLDMAQRGINFGLRYANGQATPADAKAFGIDMGRRGRQFGIEIRNESLESVEGALKELEGELPRDAREAPFKENPSDITIDAPPLPLGAASPQPEARVFGRDTIDREVKFRREF